VRLFQLPDEARNLAASTPELARALRLRLDAGRLASRAAVPAPEPTAAEREALRSLGYATDSP
jgi:hypothetical protein